MTSNLEPKRARIQRRLEAALDALNNAPTLSLFKRAQHRIANCAHQLDHIGHAIAEAEDADPS
jgi:hypothetical protein